DDLSFAGRLLLDGGRRGQRLAALADEQPAPRFRLQKNLHGKAARVLRKELLIDAARLQAKRVLPLPQGMLLPRLATTRRPCDQREPNHHGSQQPRTRHGGFSTTRRQEGYREDVRGIPT